MNLKFYLLFFVITFIKSSNSNDEFCKIKRDVLKRELTTLKNNFNITTLVPEPTNCVDYQRSIVEIIKKINFESVIDKDRNLEYLALKRKYLKDEQNLQDEYEAERRNLKDQYLANSQELESKAENIDDEIKKFQRDQANLIKNHNLMLRKYNICDEDPNMLDAFPRMEAYHPERHFGAAPAQMLLCAIPHEWFEHLKSLVNSKISTTNELNFGHDCSLERNWFLGLNDILKEASSKAQNNFDIENYRIIFERLLREKKKRFDDENFQLSQQNNLQLKIMNDELQRRKFDLQKLKQKMDELKEQKQRDLELLGLKLIKCDRFDSTLELVDEVESPNFLKNVLNQQYITSTDEEKGDIILRYLTQIQPICKKFKALVILYDIIKASSNMESPTLIEIINQIQSTMFAAKDCHVEYNQLEFLSRTLADDPTVDKILDILADNIKVGSFSKIITFNYYHPMTFGQILPRLVEKSYTGHNLDIMMRFKNELYWLLHKYDVIEKLMSIKAPTTDAEKDFFKKSLEKLQKTESDYFEHETRMDPLKNKMKRKGIKI